MTTEAALAGHAGVGAIYAAEADIASSGFMHKYTVFERLRIYATPDKELLMTAAPPTIMKS
jgi:hypothetical protein